MGLMVVGVYWRERDGDEREVLSETEAEFFLYERFVYI